MAGGQFACRSLSGFCLNAMKRYLFVMRQLPHNSSRVQETLDQLLTTAAFDQFVSLLFMDDGVFQLKSAQASEFMVMKNTAAMFLSLELYGITQVYVETESLKARGLAQDDLIMPVQLLPRTAVNGLIQQHDIVIPD
jgi:tRNA 2-thiouridine synthesizing protein C